MSSQAGTSEKQRDLEMYEDTRSSITNKSGGDGYTEDELEDRIILRKLDLCLMPSTAILLLLSFIDRSNVGNAVIAVSFLILLSCPSTNFKLEMRRANNGGYHCRVWTKISD